MTLKDLLSQIIFKFVFGALFLYFTVQNVTTTGWGFFAFLSAFFATNNIVQGIRMLDSYFKIKNNIEK